MMNRRRFVGAFAGSLVLARSIAEAQPAAKIYRIGFFLGASGESVASLFNAFNDGLRDLGYVEGRNVHFERRFADSHMDRLPAIAAELVRLRVDVIVTGSSIQEVVPKLSRVGVLGQTRAQVEFAELDTASRRLGVALEVADMQSAGDLDGAFSLMMSKRVEALLVVVSPLTYLLRESIAQAAIKHRLPTISNANQYAEAGLLMSYGPKLEDLYRRAAAYVDKILRGASPAELPVEQPSRFELIVNQRTARSLGLTLPQSLLMRSDDVIH